MWTLITWCSQAPFPCTKLSWSLCARQIVRHQFLCEEFSSHSERCHSRKESELTLRMSKQLNHTVLASFLCFLPQPDKEQEQKLPPLHPPQNPSQSCQLLLLSSLPKVCVCMCVSLQEILLVIKRTTSKTQTSLCECAPRCPVCSSVFHCHIICQVCVAQVNYT